MRPYRICQTPRAHAVSPLKRLADRNSGRSACGVYTHDAVVQVICFGKPFSGPPIIITIIEAACLRIFRIIFVLFFSYNNLYAPRFGRDILFVKKKRKTLYDEQKKKKSRNSNSAIPGYSAGVYFTSIRIESLPGRFDEFCFG